MSLKKIMGNCGNSVSISNHIASYGVRQRLSVVTFNLVQMINTGHITSVISEPDAFYDYQLLQLFLILGFACSVWGKKNAGNKVDMICRMTL